MPRGWSVCGPCCLQGVLTSGAAVAANTKDTTSRMVDMMGQAGERLREAARKPIEFVVTRIINPLARG